MRRRTGKEYKSRGIFIKIAFTYSLALIALLAFVLVTLNRFCLTFIREQRIRYNTQIQEKAAYAMKDYYYKINYLLGELCSEDKFSVLKIEQGPKDESVFGRISREVDFMADVKTAAYADGLGGEYSAVLFFDNKGQCCSAGSQALDKSFSFQGYIDTYEAARSGGGPVLVGPMEENYKKGHDKGFRAVGFMKKAGTNAVNKSQTSISRYVMLTFQINKLMEVLKSTLLEDKNFFVTDKKGRLLYQEGISKADLMSLKADKGVSNKGRLLVTSVSLEPYGWVLSVVDEKAVLFKDVNVLWVKMSLLIAVGALMSILLFLVFSRKILFPIALLKNMLRQVSRDHGTYLEVVTNDEVGEIAGNINAMKRRIQELTQNQYLLEIKTTEARLKMLQSQINPHFLYNTLDNIYCIAQIEEIDLISDLTKNLSEMLRYSIDTKKMLVTLEEEMHYLKAYLHIINIRYEDRITLHVNVDKNLWGAGVFKLMLQPLVENACLHGILPSGTTKGIITISAKRRQDDMVIEVRNNGAAISDENLAALYKKLAGGQEGEGEYKKGFGIGLENVNERLQLFYGKEYGLKIEKIGNWGTLVRVRQKYIPLT